MRRVNTINIFKFLNMLKKQKTQYLNLTKKEDTKEKCNDLYINLQVNRRVASLIICSLAYTIRSMWFYRVEDVDVWNYLDRSDFEKTYNDMRYLMLFLDTKCENTYKDYKNFKIFVDKEK